jgi:hypothetical protein
MWSRPIIDRQANRFDSSGFQESVDGLGRFCDLLVQRVATMGNSIGDTVTEVLLQETYGDGLQCFVDRGNLRENVDAVFVILDHPLQSADLTLHAS